MRSDMLRVRGFSLTEMVIVTIVIGILAAATAPLAMSSLQAYNNIESSVVVLDKLRYAMERMAREIREVNYVPGTGFAFGSMGTNSMDFTRTTYNAAGVGSTVNVTVGNTGSAVTLAYSTPAIGAQVLMDGLNGIAGLKFLYRTSDGTTTATNKLDVRIVQINLELLHNGNTYKQQTQVQLKNVN